MDDTIDVSYRVESVERFDHGQILAIASVLLEIAGVEVRLNGVTVRRDGAEHVRVIPPAYRHPRSGAWLSAIDIPAEVWDAVSVEITEALTGRPARLVA